MLSKNSGWLTAARTMSGEYGLVIRNVGSGRSPVSKRTDKAVMKITALSDSGPVELRLTLAQDESGETRFAIDADIDAERTRAPGPGARLIDAFARQLGAAIGRDAERPYMLWATVPPEPKAN